MDEYVSPLCTRYAGGEMKALFSPDKKFKTWRKLWILLAKAQQIAGLNITDGQIAEMELHADSIDYQKAHEYERRIHHDVMAHVKTFADQCPNAAPIIHLGATSCYVGDNTDLIVMREGLELLLRKLLKVIGNLAEFADKYKAMPCLAYTHLQPAQLTTVGKRAALWMSDLQMDYEELQYRKDNLKFLGSKGTTGTQASFMELFGGDEEKVKAVENFIANAAGFDKTVTVSGQTYSRKTDMQVLSALSGIAVSCSKFSYDLRILQSFKEMEEPFADGQIGSSAMAYKRNPMLSERITALTRYVIVNSLNPAFTAATQWFERTLDDSANRRIAIPEAFLAVDGILALMDNITANITVYPGVIQQRVMKELPFMATENILMDAVKKGGNRQELHERLRVLSMEAARNVKIEGLENDLISRIANDGAFNLDDGDLEGILNPQSFIGRSQQQVEEYLKQLT